ncbi:hypothetical protein GGI04_003269 [Coemansia thaxteri]|uniref:Uncharacterized protein n=1 Tax=Coemansia thaxteri TaxID=2663907 RepID=A0A9W8BMY2_9FUNG|nr:hypothetical protein GGI04_003269 [Coemansia thaxteri]KAJ2007417.1 hypothetical protein H4R26_000797 [Coemansia thaxteri]KAJ2485465.1 hypothetical protein EV174_001712 [Coemansia sp. RSA 2320]
MKITATFASLLGASVVAAAPGYHSNHGNYATMPSGDYHTMTHDGGNGYTTEAHFLRTFTDQNGYTLLVDEANQELGGFIAGIPGVDGIYNVKDEQPESGVDTWVDVHDGIYAVIDYEQPHYYTVYNSAGSPIETISHSYPTPTTNPYSTAPSHYLMTFVNQDGVTLLIDQAVTNAAIVEAGVTGVDGIYTVPAGGFPAEGSGTDTWVDSADGFVAIVDRANPNYYTVYDESSSPIATVSY